MEAITFCALPFLPLLPHDRSEEDSEDSCREDAPGATLALPLERLRFLLYLPNPLSITVLHSFLLQATTTLRMKTTARTEWKKRRIMRDVGRTASTCPARTRAAATRGAGGSRGVAGGKAVQVAQDRRVMGVILKGTRTDAELVHAKGCVAKHSGC